jgi:hypothetical protein
MNLDLYSTYTMLAAIERMMPVHSFLKDTFFPGITTFPTEEVLLDYKKGKRKMAPFVAPRVGGITVDRQGYRTEKYTAPKVAPQRALTVDDLMIRGMGENVFSNRTPEQRQAEMLARDLMELDDMISRREEWMVAQLLFTGKVVMKGYIDRTNSNFVEQELDYGFTNKVVLAGTAKWGEADANIYKNLEEWRLEVIKKSGRAPTVCIFGRDAYDKFRNDESIMKKLDLKNMILGNINPIIKSDAVTYIGRLNELGLDLYTYDEWYLDDDETLKPMVPANAVLLARPNIGEFAYGAVTQLEGDKFVTFEGKRIPKQWADQQNEQRMIRVSSRPVPKPEDVDDWFVAEVC